MITKKIFLLLFLLLVFSTVNSQKLKRSESFVGFHFDFHAYKDDKEIGKTFTAEMIDSFLSMTKPDYVQVDCKGHAGYSSYPTKVGNQAGGYTKDILKIWREVIEKHNVALYVHYSGLWDKKAISDHPEWARIRPDGKIDSLKAAYLGGYPENLLIPQLKELSDVYHIDGAWIDGDCWAAQPDYSPLVLKRFREQTGVSVIPRTPADNGYRSFVEFNRTLFRSFVRNYVDAIHSYNPNFQITSNWSFSSMMPEKPDINVDFLSGDVAGQNCVNNSAFQARCLSLQGKPWDLMAWSFTHSYRDELNGPKSLVQLEQEAAEVMAMGGGFQSYWTQNRDGSIKPWNFKQMAELASFCRQRQPFCQKATIIPQIGLWYSTHSWKAKNNSIYAGGTESLEEILTLLLDSRQQVEILMDHHLPDRIDKYPLIFLPEWTQTDENLRKQVLDYVKQGGNLLIIGGNAVKDFQSFLGVEFKDTPRTGAIYVGLNNQMSEIRTTWQPVQLNPGTLAIGRVYEVGDFRFPTDYPVIAVNNYGKGKIAGLYMDMGLPYYHSQAPVLRELVSQAIDALFPDPIVRITGSDYIHTVLAKKDNSWFIHIINTAGNHFNENVYSYAEIPSTPEINVELEIPETVRSVVLQPEGLKLNIKLENGKCFIKVPPVKVHSILQIGF